MRMICSLKIRARDFITLVLALIVMLVFTGTVSAHAVELIKSDPPAGAVLDVSPVQVHTWFNEEMQTKVSTLDVYNSAGVRIDQGDGGVDLNDANHASMVVTLQSALPEDTYTVRWHVVLLDGDASDGDFKFFVGQAAATADANLANTTQVSAQEVQPPTGNDPPSLLILGGAGGLFLVSMIMFFLARSNKRSS